MIRLINSKTRARFISSYLLLIPLSIGLLSASVTANNFLLNRAWAAENTNSSNSLVSGNLANDIKNQIKDRINNRIGDSGLAQDIKNRINDRLDKILSEENIGALSAQESSDVNQNDKKILKTHESLKGDNCRSGDVLKGASNKKDLKILSDCEEAIGTVKEVKRMNDGDYKFLLKLRDKYKFLLNKVNKKKTGGYLIVEIVPKDQDSKDVQLPKRGDKVHIWGAWVTDKPKGWHEIHPAWKVVVI